MGLLDFLKKPKDVKGSFSNEKVERKKGVVYITPNGKTYHASCDCFGSNTDEYAEVPEQAAVQAGFKRCKKCDWDWWERTNR